MLFYLHGASFSLAAAMSEILSDCRCFARAYYNECIVASRGREQDLQNLEKIFQKLSSYCLHINTWIYDLIFVPQITRLFLGDVIISSKTVPHNGSKKEKRSCGKIKNNKTMLKILPFIRILYLKQQSSILRCFSRLKFKKKVYLAIHFSVLCFAVRWYFIQLVRTK